VSTVSAGDTSQAGHNRGTMVIVTSWLNQHTFSWAALALSLAVCCLAALSPNDMSESDSALTLIAAQAWCEHGTPDLSPYQSDPRFSYDLENDYRVRNRSGGFFYYNIGPPIAMVPVVYVARSLGLDMVDPEDEKKTQNLISALLCGITFGLTFLLTRTFVGGGAALAITGASILGSPLISTSATALWSQTIALPLMLMALLATVRCDPEAGSVGRFTLPRLLFIPPLLFAAFLCRPTAGFLVLGVLAWLINRLRITVKSQLSAGKNVSSPFKVGHELVTRCQRHRLLCAAALVAIVVLAIVALGWLLPYLPRYYQPARLLPRISPLFGLYAVLLSPSRGLLIFCPFLVVVVIGLVRTGRRLDFRPLLTLAAVWSVSHLAALSVRSVWWGGHSFGPRLAAEVVLAALIPTAIVWKTLTSNGGDDTPPQPRARRWVMAYLLAGGLAVVIHSGQGLFNPSVKRWNYRPNVDTHQDLLMSWRYPQFLATEQQIAARQVEIQRRRLEPYQWGDRIEADDSKAVFAGWYRPEGPRRWSQGTAARLEIRLPMGSDEHEYQLTIRASGLKTQHVTVSINGNEIGTLLLRYPPANHSLRLLASELRPGEINHLDFDIPDAQQPDNGDPRILGIDYHWCRITLGSPKSSPEPAPVDGDRSAVEETPTSIES